MTAMQRSNEHENAIPLGVSVLEESQGHESEEGGGNEPTRRVRRRTGPFKRSRTGCKWAFCNCFDSLTNISKQVAHARGLSTKLRKRRTLTVYAGGVKSAMKSGRLKVIARGASSGNSNVAVEPTSKANQLPEEPSSNKEQRV